MALVIISVVGIVAVYQSKINDPSWPHIDALRAERLGENTEVFSADKRRLGAIALEQNREIIELEAMGKWAPAALIATEDRRFYEHDGVDRRGIARAMVANIKARGIVEGASTIDQQLIRNIYAEIGDDQTLTRKMKEATLAQELNSAWTKQYESRKAAKEHILALYLNTVFFGNSAYGIEAASQTYFGVSASELEPHQAAMLIGLVQSPSAYDPLKQPDAAIKRRNQVLQAMCDTGKLNDCEQWSSKNLDMSLGKKFNTRMNPYVFDYVQRELESAYGDTAARQGGLQVLTSIDAKLQRQAINTMRSVLSRKDDPVAAMVIIENKTGLVRAMASSTRYRATQYNFAADAKRQPGSSAKIWGLAALVQAGVDPATTNYLSTPLAIQLPDGAGLWKPSTYSGSYAGLDSVHEATIRSDNAVYAQIALDIGPNRIADTARSLGIDTTLEAVPSIILGSQGVTPLEQTNFYSTIARGGVRIEPRILREVISTSGSKREIAKADAQRVMFDWQADEIRKILQENVSRGTGTAAQLNGIPAAGKTGTTDDYKDAWFCGFTPLYTGCVWVGYPQPKPMRNVHGITVAGGTFPAQIWGKVMRIAHDGKRVGSWPPVKGKNRKQKSYPAWCNRPDLTVVEGPRSLTCSSTKEDGKQPSALQISSASPDA